MRSLLTSIGLMFFLNLAFSEEFSIEEKNLTALPKPVVMAIRAPKNFEFPECNLVGKVVNITDTAKASEYIATTSQACGWGAAAGPVWVVAKVTGGYTVVLQTTAYATEILKHKDHGLHQLVTTSGTAGHASYTRWGFTGKTYRQLENYVFLPDNEKLCKAHKEICPFESNN
jgi:hypothetical protein